MADRRSFPCRVALDWHHGLSDRTASSAIFFGCGGGVEFHQGRSAPPGGAAGVESSSRGFGGRTGRGFAEPHLTAIRGTTLSDPSLELGFDDDRKLLKTLDVSSGRIPKHPRVLPAELGGALVANPECRA